MSYVTIQNIVDGLSSGKWKTVDNLARALEREVDEIIPFLMLGENILFNFDIEKGWVLSKNANRVSIRGLQVKLMSIKYNEEKLIEKYNKKLSARLVPAKVQVRHTNPRDEKERAMQIEGDYSNLKLNSESDGNAFEHGSRSPRWRGGVDKTTQARRAKTYSRYGIGVQMAANSAAALNSIPISAIDHTYNKSPLAEFCKNELKSLELVTRTPKELSSVLHAVDPLLRKRSMPKISSNARVIRIIQGSSKQDIKMTITASSNYTADHMVRIYLEWIKK